MNLFADILKKKDLISIDIETSGVDTVTDKIWSLGISDKDFTTKEIMYHPGEDVEGFKQKLSSIEGLSEKQQKHGVLQKYFGVLDDGLNIPQGQISRDISSLMNENNAVLIQNAMFENRFLSKELMNNPEVGVPFRDNFMYRGDDSSKYFYVPPEVQNKRSYAAQAYDSFLNGNNEAFGDVVGNYRNMMKAYGEASANKGLMVIDLMDVSKATYAMAAEKGLIDKRFIGVGLNIEFLAKHVLNKEEIHGAASDASQQMEIFKRLSNVYHELETGAIGQETKDLFKSISAAHPRERIQQMHRAVKDAMRQADIGKGYKKLTFKEVYDASPVFGPNGREMVKLYGTPIKGNAELNPLIHTKDKKEAAHHALDRYERMGVDKPTIARVRNIIDNGGDVNHILNDPGITENIAAAGRVAKDRIKLGKDWFNALPTKHKLAAVGTAILGAGYILSDSSNSDEKIKELKKKEEQIKSKMYTDSTLRMYSNIPNYHGSGFASWNDRTKHHEY